MLGAAPLIPELLATSRSPLLVLGEYLLPVPTLSLPDRAHQDRLDLLARTLLSAREAEVAGLIAAQPPAE